MWNFLKRLFTKSPADNYVGEDFEDIMTIDEDGNWICESSDSDEIWVAPKGDHTKAYTIPAQLNETSRN